MATSPPLDPFGRARLPDDFSREHRLRLIDEVRQALLDGRQPSPAAAMFVAGAFGAWLCEGGRVGSLERDYFKVAAPRRSKQTPKRLWDQMKADERSTCRATTDADDDTMEAGHRESPP